MRLDALVKDTLESELEIENVKILDSDVIGSDEKCVSVSAIKNQHNLYESVKLNLRHWDSHLSESQINTIQERIERETGYTVTRSDSIGGKDSIFHRGHRFDVRLQRDG